MKILLVDDSSTMRRIEKNTLERLGYTDVTEAGDGAEAIKVLAGQKFDLILMDWNMPNLNGIDTLKQIKADQANKATPVIMVTSEAEKSKIVEAMRAGAANYVVKPFEPEVLMEKISAAVKK